MVRSPHDAVAHAVADVAYVSVGLGVLALQRLRVRRHELGKAFGGQADAAGGALDLVSTAVGERLKAVEERVGAVLERH
jgi:hypothetical protein